jgi:hypothetical protein
MKGFMTMMRIAKGLCLLAIMVIILGGCSVKNEVYMMIYCPLATDVPFTLTINTPPFNAMAFGSIVQGQYYYVTPGTYSVTVDYVAPITNFTTVFTITEDTPIMGRQNKYYDLILRHYVAPELVQVPK